jgi:uncharacterized phosphosugar-binding protein
MANPFIPAVEALVASIAQNEASAIGHAARLVADAAEGDRLVHLFGTGHSQLLEGEGFFRAGGLACVNPLFVPELGLYRGPLEATAAERDVRFAALVFERYAISSGDAMLVFSNSGVNAVPVEVARRARHVGAAVIGIASKEYMARAISTHPDHLKLESVVDVLVDTHVPPGDALIRLDGIPAAVGPASTIASALVLNAVLVEAVQELVGRGVVPPVYVSSKLHGADEHNARLVARYRSRIPQLVAS